MNLFPVAFAAGEFGVEYLPVFDLKQRKMIALEAVMRWNRAGCEATRVEDIVAAATYNECLTELDDWWLPTVLIDIQHLQAKRNYPKVLMRLHNISDPELLRQRIQDCGELRLREKPILLVEEAGLNRLGDPLVKVLSDLGALGYKLALDHFGRGHTSYSHLLKLPLLWLKLEPELVGGALYHEADGTLIYNIVNLAHSLGIDVIAGGIHNEEQFWLMCNAGCDLGEGDEFLGPLPLQSFIDMLVGHDASSRRVLR